MAEEQSPREALLAEVREAIQRHSGMGYFTRALRALEVLAEELIGATACDSITEKALGKALAILRGIDG